MIHQERTGKWGMLISTATEFASNADELISDLMKNNKSLRQGIVWAINGYIASIYILGVPFALWPTCSKFSNSFFLWRLTFFFPFHLLIASCFTYLVLRSYYLACNTSNAFQPSIRGIEKNAYYCLACRQSKPMRVHHCSTCKKCCLRMDHHCVFINNCVGYQNYRYFFMFLVWVVLGSFYVETIGITRLVQIGMNWRIQKYHGFFDVVELVFLSVIVSSLLLVLGLVASMLLKQIFNIWQNKTEVEAKKMARWRTQRFKEGGHRISASSPYDRGFALNFRQWMGPPDIMTLLMVTPSNLQMREGLEYPIKPSPHLDDNSFREIWGITEFDRSHFTSVVNSPSDSFSNRASGMAFQRKRAENDDLPKYYV